jgi:hypothetical protein
MACRMQWAAHAWGCMCMGVSVQARYVSTSAWIIRVVPFASITPSAIGSWLRRCDARACACGAWSRIARVGCNHCGVVAGRGITSRLPAASACMARNGMHAGYSNNVCLVDGLNFFKVKVHLRPGRAC